jgi:transcriptional regulator with GAF, ATPase, and Fis domain
MGSVGRSLEQYRRVIYLSEVLNTYRDQASLLEGLSCELRQVISADFVGLGLYDAAHGTGLLPELEADEALAEWVVGRSEPLVIPVVAEEARFPQAIGYLRSQGIEAVCVLPLIAIERRVLGILVAGEREPHAAAVSDVEFLPLVARHVALAIERVHELGALQHAVVEQRERAERLETSDELLRALSHVLDIREVFPQVSHIAAKVLPHDRLTMTFHDGHGEIVIEANAGGGAPRGARLRCGNPSRMLGDSSTILEDINSQTFEVIEPENFWDGIRADGLRSLLAVGLKARDQQMGLLFWSKQPRAFCTRDVPVARRIADHVALAVSHEQLAEASRQIAEARARAERLEVRANSLAAELDAKTGYSRVIGRSAQWQGVLKAATQVAVTDTTVLLTGESGTGKEVVARFIHRASSRKTGPFVALNCAALPEQLLESELFGYERGAFTSAQQAKPGQLELASGGVLFLDEVSEMSLSAQAKFLRVLQEREFQRLGGTRIVKANVRVIAATNRDLKKAIDRKEFREDLFYRLQVFDIAIPPLRERPADILQLSEAFLQEVGQMLGRPPAGLTRDAKEALLGHRWPGNVRELRNALERAAILCEGGLITAEHLSFHDREQRLPASDVAQSTNLNVVEREMIARVLRECNGNKSRAARQLGLTRTQLYHRLRRYQLG